MYSLESLLHQEIRNSLPTEVFHYTKDHGDLLFQNDTGLKLFQFPLEPEPTQAKKSAYKRKSNNQRGKRTNPYADVIGTDLSRGYEKFKPKSTKEIFQLDDVLRCVQYSLSMGKDISSFKIITLRRVMTLLMEIPVHLREIRFNVIYWKGLIFLDYDWEHSLADSATINKYQYSGFRFEQVMTKNTHSSEFYTFASHTIQDTPVHYTAEIDAGDGESHYLELKTHSHSDSKLSPDNTSLKLKFIKVLCQIGFIECDKCIFGFRAPNCQLKAVRTFSKSAMHDFLQKSPLSIKDAKSTLELSHATLQSFYNGVIKAICDNEPDTPDYAVYKLSFQNGESFTEAGIRLDRVNKESTKVFSETIPPWFQKYLKQNHL